MIAPPKVSWSRIETLSDCGLRFKLRYLDHAPGEPSGPLIGGSTVHDVIRATEERVMAGEASFADPELSEAIGKAFQEMFMKRVREAGEGIRWGGRESKDFPDKENDLWWMKMGPVMLRRYLALRTFDINDGARLWDSAIERGISVVLDDDSYLSAVFDAVLLVDHDGTLKLRDYKSGQVGRSEPMQLAVYSWLLQRALHITATQGEFIYLRTGGNSMIQPYDLTDLLPIVPEILEGYARTTEAGVYVMKPRKAWCKQCDVRMHCPFGRTLDSPK